MSHEVSHRVWGDAGTDCLASIVNREREKMLFTVPSASGRCCSDCGESGLEGSTVVDCCIAELRNGFNHSQLPGCGVLGLSRPDAPHLNLLL